MAIEFISIKCPECFAPLEIEEGRQQIFCSYCGTKVLIQNDNEYIYRHIDEAKIKKVENDSAIRLKELEMEETRYNQNSKIHNIITKIWLVVSLVLIIIAVGIMFFSKYGSLYGFSFLFYVCGPIIGGGAHLVFNVIPDKENNQVMLQKGGIRLPKDIFPYSEKNYETVYTYLKNAGFQNVTCVNMRDLTFGIFQKPGKIESISINGETVRSGGKAYLPDVPIIITYHGI